MIGASFCEAALLIILVLVCGMESYYLYSKELLPSDVSMDSSLPREGFLFRKHV